MNKLGRGKRQMLQWLARRGREYVKKILAEDLRKVGVASVGELTEDAWKSVRWMLSSFFYRGRRDELSQKYRDAALEALDEVTKGLHTPQERIQECVSHIGDIEALYRERVERSTAKSGEKYKVNSNDVLLLKSYLTEFVPSLKEYGFNPVRYVLAQLDQLGRVHDRLCEIQSVGPKLASMFLRDVICLFRKENHVGKTHSRLLQPVDTWVRRVAGFLWSNLKSASDADIRNRIVDSCSRASRRGSKVSPVNVNQGMWYIGTNSLGILLRTVRGR